MYSDSAGPNPGLRRKAMVMYFVITVPETTNKVVVVRLDDISATTRLIIVTSAMDKIGQ